MFSSRLQTHGGYLLQLPLQGLRLHLHQGTPVDLPQVQGVVVAQWHDASLVREKDYFRNGYGVLVLAVELDAGAPKNLDGARGGAYAD